MKLKTVYPNALFSYRTAIVLATVVACIAMAPASHLTSHFSNPEKPDTATHTAWKDFGGGPDHSKFVVFNQINKKNISKLQPVFVYATADNQAYRFNPIIVDNVMYVLGKNSSLIAVNATTGKEIWIHANLRGIIQRGVNFWQSADGKQKRLLICLGNSLQAINANTGKSILTFGDNGSVDLKKGLDRDPGLIGRAASTTPGHIYKDLLLVGSSPGENLFSGPGHLRAFNVITGKQEWIFHTIPYPGEAGYETWPNDAYKYVGAVNAWGEISVDEKRGIAYYPLGSPTYDYDGADRAGQGLYGNCILALDARTGKHLWHFQTVHHDIWDYDLTAAPQLITVKHKGKKVDAVAVASKNGFLYVFNRVTGEPLWPIEERPVSPSDMPDEQAWPTQPFPTVIPPFQRHIVTENDINPNIPAAAREKFIARVKAARKGMYQPLSDKYEVIATPGAVGGANYGNTAANPDKGLVYVMFQELADFYKLKKRDASSPRMGQVGGNNALAVKGEVLYKQICQPCHGADHAGIVGAGVSLVDLGVRVNAETFKNIISQGKGRMPALPHVDDATIAAIYAFLAPSSGRNNQPASTSATLPEGPVVASGGAPVTQPQTRGGMRDYPEGYTGPKVQYVERNNWGEGVDSLLTAPWSGIAAYDLNKGTLKWRIPLGENQWGVPGGTPNGTQNKGMVVTASGLLFVTCKDGKVRGLDANNGKIIWEYDLGRKDPGGIPAMYWANGRQYLVVCSTGPLKDKTKKETDVAKGYVVFALPEKLRK
ncbi:quinoprotein glucose dehydrogenase [Mucilaginibacter limnophilus]|uniref:Quinoprotein glucose dehydrogenase n=1 Tax=Mucilaginibacter limnophilus TaxID=1932778 RepID=A0A437MYR8_9SPHI|nr:PQQ-binding-like beta-propeller repeat protein [Mucilaginibacter limnophilus]RVU02820.1 quinoprotein glucose dehydrogenase [Mucilaginibacter limnophilus]